MIACIYYAYLSDFKVAVRDQFLALDSDNQTAIEDYLQCCGFSTRLQSKQFPCIYPDVCRDVIFQGLTALQKIVLGIIVSEFLAMLSALVLILSIRKQNRANRFLVDAKDYKRPKI